MWGCGASFLKTRRNVRILSKISPQSPKKLPEYGLYESWRPPPRNSSCAHVLGPPRTSFLPSVQSVRRHFVVTFWFHFQKKWIRGFQTCRKILIRSALKSSDPGASNGGSNLELRPLEADLVSSEVARLSEKRKISSPLGNGPKCVWKLKTQSCQRSEEIQDKFATPPRTSQICSDRESNFSLKIVQ